MYPKLINYSNYKASIPQSGHHILAYQTKEEILVYQAYNDSIANFALENQFFGGNNFKYSRMSWIKPNFLWMMYRCGWAEKSNQERVLGIWLKKSEFNKILKEAVYSSFQDTIYDNQDEWKTALENKEVRLQWDPDHDLFGNKENRKAIQLGLKGEILLAFGKEMISKIIDMTSIVKEQKINIDSGEIDKVLVPQEWAYQIDEINLRNKLKLRHTTTNNL